MTERMRRWDVENAGRTTRIRHCRKMIRATPLPPPLDRMAFTVADARAAGVSATRLRARDLDRPFWGVRVQIDDGGSTALFDAGEAGEESAVHLARLAAYRARMREVEFFSHSTAAQLHGIPLPSRLERASPVHVAVVTPALPPEIAGVTGHRMRTGTTVMRDGFRVASALDAWLQLAPLLCLEDVIAAGDYLLTGPDPFRKLPPLATLEEMRAAVEEHGGHRGIRKLRAALPLTRSGPLSRKETQLRLFIVGIGLPEPIINHPVQLEDGRWVYLDLAYPRLKLGFEYEGDWHRTSRPKFVSDIHRREGLADIDWEMMRVVSDDLDAGGRDSLARRIRRRVATRASQLNLPLA